MSGGRGRGDETFWACMCVRVCVCVYVLRVTCYVYVCSRVCTCVCVNVHTAVVAVECDWRNSVDALVYYMTVVVGVAWLYFSTL